MKKASKVDTPLARKLHGTPPAAADSTSAFRQVQPINTIVKATLLKKDVPQAANTMAPHDQRLLRDKQSRVQQRVRDCDKTRNKDNVCNKFGLLQRWDYKPLLTIKNHAILLVKKEACYHFQVIFPEENDVYNLPVMKFYCAATDRRKAVRETWVIQAGLILHAGWMMQNWCFDGKCTSEDDLRRVSLSRNITMISTMDFKDSFRNLTVRSVFFWSSWQNNARALIYLKLAIGL